MKDIINKLLNTDPFDLTPEQELIVELHKDLTSLCHTFDFCSLGSTIQYVNKCWGKYGSGEPEMYRGFTPVILRVPDERQSDTTDSTITPEAPKASVEGRTQSRSCSCCTSSFCDGGLGTYRG